MFKLFTLHHSQIGWLLRGRLIFISYRRNDSVDIAGRISDHLARDHGRDRIFRDIDSIPPGSDFLELIEDAIRNSRALIAVIGPSWATDRATGRSYFNDDPEDVLGLELQCARRWGIPIYPVLVNGARLPSAASLPPELKFLAGLQATRVRSDSDFHNDIARLQRAIECGKPGRRSRKGGMLSRALPMLGSRQGASPQPSM